MAAALAPQSSTAEILKSMDTIKAPGIAGEPIGDSLKNFLEIAMKMAQIDEAIMGARASAPAPEDSEACKWHDVSIKALVWTRSSLAEQQGNALAQLKNVATTQRSLSSHVAPTLPPAAPVFAFSATTPAFLPSASQEKLKAQVKSSKLLSPSQAGARVASGEHNVGSLSDDLELLKQYDPQQCLIVRRIKRLGLGSPEILRQHFSGFGAVKEMLISHSFEKKSAKCRADRVRPAALGFIVMASVDGAKAALRAGPTIMIGDVDVEVKVFEPIENLQKDGAKGAPGVLASLQ